jgi:hypothetical protein
VLLGYVWNQLIGLGCVRQNHGDASMEGENRSGAREWNGGRNAKVLDCFQVSTALTFWRQLTIRTGSSIEVTLEKLLAPVNLSLLLFLHDLEAVAFLDSSVLRSCLCGLPCHQ